MAETITAIIDIDVDLDSGAKPVPLSMQLVYGNQRAHTFRVRAYRAGQQVYMSGVQAIGYVRRADGTTIELTGVVSLDMVEVTLTEACYAVTGLATISIDLVIGDVIATCMVATAQVDNVKSDYAVSPGSGGGTVVVTGAVRYDITQVLTEDQKARARDNIGAGTGSESGGSIAGAVRFDIEQGLEDAQKAQARANIGVTSTGADISGLIDDNTTAPDKVWSSENTAGWIADMTSGLSGQIGTLSDLDTTDKSSIVAAINEVNAKAGSGGSGEGAGIDDTTTSTTTTWSSSKITQAINDAAAGETLPTDPLRIECWGDSLTFGAGAAGSDYSYSEAYPKVLAEKVGMTVYNYGVGGETSETILARMGATPMYVEQIYIPAAAGDASSVILRSATGAEVTPLMQAASQDKGVNPVSIGGVMGTLSYDAETGYSFARTTAGTAVAHLLPTVVETAYMRTVSDNRVRIIWMGQNDIDDEEMGSDMSQLGQYLIEACRAAIRGVDKYIILTAPVSTGTTATPYKPIHRAMVHAFGDHCINIVDYLIRYGLTDAGITATEQDTADMSAYYIPQSLRYDRVHLNAAGYAVVADQVYKRGQLLGYWT